MILSSARFERKLREAWDFGHSVEILAAQLGLKRRLADNVTPVTKTPRTKSWRFAF